MRGYLDNLTSSGFLEGWALNPEQLLLALPVAVVAEGVVIACGRAHRFRKDLMESKCGTGWCAYRLAVEGPREHLPHVPLILIESTSGTVLHENPSVSCVDDPAPVIDTVAALCAYDPTVLEGVWQLRGCERLAMAYIRKHGVEHYVRQAYTYVLGRPADGGGLAQYGRAIRQTTLSPVGVLEALADSDEFRSQPRQLIAPNALGFPFA